MTVIEIRPHRWGWKAFESPGVEPVFPDKDQAIDYAQCRACFHLRNYFVAQSEPLELISAEESDRLLCVFALLSTRCFRDLSDGLRIAKSTWRLNASTLATKTDSWRPTLNLIEASIAAERTGNMPLLLRLADENVN
jgi:hypothetical protein